MIGNPFRHSVAQMAFVGALAASLCFDNATSSANTPFDVQSFVDGALERGESTIVLPPGRHHVVPTERVHLRLRGLRDVSIVADGFEMVCTQTTRALEIEDCHGLTLSGLSIDYDPLPFTQGRIVSISADKRVHEIELIAGYPDASTAVAKKYQIFRGEDQALRGVDYYAPQVDALGPDRLRVTKSQRGPTPQEEVGDWIVISATAEGTATVPHAVMLEGCSGVRLERVTVYASNSFAFLENDCDRTVYDGCRVARRASGDDPVRRAAPRIRSANADAFHSKRATRGPQITRCYAHYQGDDCVNINGDYHLVSQANGRRLRVIAKRSMDIRVGDPVEIAEPSGEAVHKARVVAVDEAGYLTQPERLLVASLNLHPSLRAQVGDRLRLVYEVELDRSVRSEPGSLIAATNRRGDGFEVAECDFGDVRSRGIIIKASNGEVRDNKLTRCRMESIKLAAESYWLESGSASNVRIHGNTITDGGSVAIAVYARGDIGGFASGRAHRRITISDNRIVRSPLPNVFVSSTNSVRLIRNASYAGADAPSSEHVLLRSVAAIDASSPPILLHHCHDVVMRSNTTR